MSCTDNLSVLKNQLTCDDNCSSASLAANFRKKLKNKKVSNLLGISPFALAACGGGSGEGAKVSDGNQSIEAIVNEITLRYIDLSGGDFVVIPTDISEISSLSDYTTATISNEIFSFDPYDVNPDVVAYPESWSNSLELNFEPKGNLSANVGRAIAIKDIILFENPNWTSAERLPGNSSEDLHDSFDTISKNLRNLDIDLATITQWSWGTDNQDGTYSIINPNEVYGPIKDEDLEYFTGVMSDQGIEVGMWSQIQAFVDENGSTYLPDINEESITQWYDAYGEFISDRAPFYEKIGISEWELSCDFCAVGAMYDSVQGGNNRKLILQETINIVDLARSEFSGEITVPYDFDHIFNARSLETQELYDLEYELITKADGVHFNLYTSEDMAEKVDTLVENEASSSQLIETFKQEFMTQIHHIEQLAQFTDKIYINVQLQSRSDVFSNPGYLEETGKTSEVQTSDGVFIEVDTTLEDSVQERTQVDFALQAIYFEAAMQVIDTLNVDAEIVVIGGEYFVPVQVIPDETYPNLGTTIRNKPSEYIIDQWFSQGSEILDPASEVIV